MATTVGVLEIGGCGGCSVSFLRALPELAMEIEVVFFPLCLDVTRIPKRVDVFFVCGAVCTEDSESVTTVKPIRSAVSHELSILGCPPPPEAIHRFSRMLTDEDAGTRFNVYRELSRVGRLSCYDLQDDVVAERLCVGCGVCQVSCPTLAIRLLDGSPDFEVERCIRCGVC